MGIEFDREDYYKLCSRDKQQIDDCTCLCDADDGEKPQVYQPPKTSKMPVITFIFAVVFFICFGIVYYYQF